MTIENLQDRLDELQTGVYQKALQLRDQDRSPIRHHFQLFYLGFFPWEARGQMARRKDYTHASVSSWELLGVKPESLPEEYPDPDRGIKELCGEYYTKSCNLMRHCDSLEYQNRIPERAQHNNREETKKGLVRICSLPLTADTIKDRLRELDGLEMTYMFECRGPWR